VQAQLDNQAKDLEEDKKKLQEKMQEQQQRGRELERQIEDFATERSARRVRRCVVYPDLRRPCNS
jgi:cell division protein FtsB